MRRSRAVVLPFASTVIWLLSLSACGGAADKGNGTTTPPDTMPTQTPTVPAAPTGLSATSTSASSITLTWTRNSSNETGFQVERSTGGSGTFGLIATTAAGATTYSDTAVAASTTYNYRVRAVGSAGTSAYSNVATLTTPAGCPAATAVTQDIAITTNWTASTTTGCAAYRVSGNVKITASLTIQPGTVISFASGAALTVSTGSLGAFGNPASRIRFTGDNAARGSWKGITFLTPNAANELSYVDVSYGGGDGTTSAADVAVLGGAQLKMSHTLLEQSAGVGLFLDDIATLGPFASDTLRNNAKAGIRLPDRLVGSLDNVSSYASGNGVPYLDVYAVDVSSPQLWQVTTAPIHISGQTTVSSDLVIAPGVNVQFGANSGMTVTTGSLSAVGTPTSRIQFSPEQQQRGYWRGLSIQTNNASNRLSYVNVSYGGGGTDTNAANLAVASGGNLQLDNSVVEQSARVGLYAAGTATLPLFSANTIRNNADVGVRVPDRLLGSLDVGSDYATGNGVQFVDAIAFGVGTVQTWRITALPIRFSGQTTISAGLTLAPGVTIVVRSGGNFTVANGSLTAIGTAASRIKFVGEQSTPGFWCGLVFSTGNGASELTYTEVAHAGAGCGTRAANVGVSPGGSLKLTNSNIHDSAGWGLYVELNGIITPTPVAGAGNVFASNALGGSNVP
jgi:fibronectin type 3 domain-containing protein